MILTGVAPSDDPAARPRYVSATVSERARGLCLDVDLTPDRVCNFNCVYCDIDRSAPSRSDPLDVAALTREVTRALDLIARAPWGPASEISQRPREFLELQAVALSGQGEPTLCPEFADAVRAITHLRARAPAPFFKLVLMTNGSLLHQPEVQAGLQLLTPRDEIWIKLDGGTRAYLEQINRPRVAEAQVLANILELGRRRAIVIQSLFPRLLAEGADPHQDDAGAPSLAEVAAYVARLQELKACGAQIDLVQIYSAHPSATMPACSHLPLRILSRIAQQVRAGAGLRAEVF